jgi:1-acyl-sn-glycerol-3-phosphate acyltransferase
MHKPYRTPVVAALPDIKVPEPNISPFIVFLTRVLGRLYLFLFYGVARIVLSEDRILFDAFKRALSGQSRCIIAFRHPNGGEPQLLNWTFLFKLRALAARKGVRFARRPHAISVYGYEVVRWGGWPVRLVMPNLGALPIHHAKVDSQGMSRIYRAVTDGPYPLMLAPEGQVSYTTDSVPRLEPGIVRIGFHAARQMLDKNMNCPLEILPVSIHFSYGSWGKGNMEVLLRRIEKFCGFYRRAEGKKLPFEERLRRCRDHILDINEKRYGIKAGDGLPFEERLEQVVNAALETAERMLGIKREGDFFARMYKVRQICWDRIFLPGVDDFKHISRLERGALDLKAGEAWYIDRHQELVDFCWYFRRPLPTEETNLHSRIEYVQNLWDFANRTMGGAISGRVNIFPRKVIIHTAPPINLSGRLPRYQEDKKAAVAESLSVLEKAFLDSIDYMNNVLYGKANAQKTVDGQ